MKVARNEVRNVMTNPEGN